MKTTIDGCNVKKLFIKKNGCIYIVNLIYGRQEKNVFWICTREVHFHDVDNSYLRLFIVVVCNEAVWAHQHISEVKEAFEKND